MLANTALANSYTVSSGDTLYSIAKKNSISVDQLKKLNGLSSNTIFSGQKLLVSANTVESSKTNTVEYSKIEYRTVTASSLNVRSGAGKTYTIIGSLLKNTKVEVISSNNGWYKIKFKDSIGYASADYFSAPTYVSIQTGVSNTSKNSTVSTKTTTTSKSTSTLNTTLSTNTVYVVKSGDSLYRIALNNKTTVAKIKELNKLKSDNLAVGQKIILSANATSTTSNKISNTATVSKTTESKVDKYTVVKGDSLSVIANKYKTTVSAITQENNLISTLIYIGQVLSIPSANVDNKTTTVSTNLFIQPAEGVLTSNYGYRIHPITGVKKLHGGIDIAKSGTVNILAAAEGTVTLSGYVSGFGECIVISHTINGQKYSTLYGHMRSNSRKVSVGDKVAAGRIIGLMGSTGDVTGQHLHFEVHKGGYNGTSANAVDPLQYVSLK